MGKWHDESGTKNPFRFLLPEDIRPWLLAQKRPSWPRFHVTHHTWSPTWDAWRGKSSLLAILRYYHDQRGFTYGKAPQAWVSTEKGPGSPAGLWICYHPYYNYGVGATGWNGDSEHTEVAWNGDIKPFASLQWDILNIWANALNEWVGIPLTPVHFGSNGGALKTRGGQLYHRHAYVNGKSPKSCPGTKNLTSALSTRYYPLETGGLSMADIDTILKRLDAMQADIDASQRADSHRSNILIAKLFGGDVEAAIAAAKKDGVALPNLDPQ